MEDNQIKFNLIKVNLLLFIAILSVFSLNANSQSNICKKCETNDMKKKSLTITNIEDFNTYFLITACDSLTYVIVSIKNNLSIDDCNKILLNKTYDFLVCSYFDYLIIPTLGMSVFVSIEETTLKVPLIYSEILFSPFFNGLYYCFSNFEN